MLGGGVWWEHCYAGLDPPPSKMHPNPALVVFIPHRLLGVNARGPAFPQYMEVFPYPNLNI